MILRGVLSSFSMQNIVFVVVNNSEDVKAAIINLNLGIIKISNDVGGNMPK